MAQATLPVLESTRYVTEHSRHVTINKDAIHQMLLRGIVRQSWTPDLHLADPDWIFVLDALNFCFWEDAGQEKWSIEYHGERLSGYWALAAALRRAMEEGVPLTNAEFLSTVSSKSVEKIFRGRQRIPLFQKRVDNLREVGRVLLEEYDGSFVNVLQRAGQSAVELVKDVVAHFPSFNDIALYENKTIFLYKRAQLLAADINGAFEGEGYGAFHDLNQLTIFADYKLPQVLRHYHVLEYDRHLTHIVDNYLPCSPGSREEVEIRAATIQAVELMRQELSNGHDSVPSFKLDWWLWSLGQDDAVREKPYHRTRTIFY
ncbi:hypothetical protein CSB45_13510 [candidate division KSB3 bacterium]|uniref:Queuosine 5'-phosphate N-glycosylase/hydrolase n=1 Tax=candidate division KSB3 bacterium TaxID=2044937 RepID=A0A2G6E1K7_9BACT|nr:MAG: hypothetical protein CSB45_13510 [candidate division KSB3 bacterium]PIE28577.1 MAG: hypothetical protein CSA57_13160 [candidate division KSB3 bacterium]